MEKSSPRELIKKLTLSVCVLSPLVFRFSKPTVCTLVCDVLWSNIILGTLFCAITKLRWIKVNPAKSCTKRFALLANDTYFCGIKTKLLTACGFVLLFVHSRLVDNHCVC